MFIRPRLDDGILIHATKLLPFNKPTPFDFQIATYIRTKSAASYPPFPTWTLNTV